MILGVFSTIITPILTTLITLGGMYLIERWKKKNEPDLSDPDFEDNIKDLLDRIKDEVGATRVNYWEGSNGTNTLSGYHIKKLSMMAESNADGVREIKDEMQMIPITTFKRNMDLLRESEDGVAFSLEYKQNDVLSDLYKEYGIDALYIFKVKTIFNKWTGILMIGFDSPELLDDPKLAWLKTQASRIGTMIRNKTANPL